MASSRQWKRGRRGVRCRTCDTVLISQKSIDMGLCARCDAQEKAKRREEAKTDGA